MYDVVIAGGGMVGASLAVALAPLGLRVAIVEAFAFSENHSQPSYDERSVALSYGSSLIYQDIGIWPELQSAAEPIHTIHVSDKGYFGATRLHASQEKVPALGYVIENRVLGGVLHNALQGTAIDIIAPAKLETIEQASGNSADESEGIDESVTLSVVSKNNTQTLRCRLLVIAAGANSGLQTQLGIQAREHDYQQAAVIANVSTAKSHNQVAYERFTRSGPLALLPLSRDRYSLVWTRRADEVDETLALDDAGFLRQLQKAFGYRQGEFVQVGQRNAYPLTLVKSATESAGRALLIGNASHTLHPVAGQGLNLSLRDVTVLTGLLRQAVADGEDIGGSTLLAEYSRLRESDYQRVVRYTDSLVKAFSSDLPGLGHLLASGLLAVDRVGVLRKQLARQSMGLQFKRANTY